MCRESDRSSVGTVKAVTSDGETIRLAIISQRICLGSHYSHFLHSGVA